MSDLIKRARELAALASDATPGPWSVYNDQIGNRHLSVRHYFEAVSVNVCELYGDDRGRADAALIAAAPEMAELLRKLATQVELMEGGL